MPLWAQPIDVIMLKVFVYGGWIPILIVVLLGFADIWLASRREKWKATRKYVLLAINVPGENEQTPKAMENFFSHVQGIKSGPSLKEKWLEGQKYSKISCEIVSIDGYVQYLIRSETKHRDLVESAIYSQFPDAQINEVDDYVDNVPGIYPNDTHELAGFEFKLRNPYIFPLKTYMDFEHAMSKELKDPLANILEVFSSIKPGEQMWLQMIVTALPDQSWRSKGEGYIKKAYNIKEVAKPGVVGKAFAPVTWAGKEAARQIFSAGEAGAENKPPDRSLTELQITMQEKKRIEAVQRKITKIGFGVKIRWIYVARKDVYNKSPRRSAIKGAMQQFTNLDLNEIKSDSKTSPNYDYFWYRWWVPTRQRKLMRGYRKRDNELGTTPYVLNIEELSTLFHFPSIVAQAPAVFKTESRRAEPPVSLPAETMETMAAQAPAKHFVPPRPDRPVASSQFTQPRSVESESADDQAPRFSAPEETTNNDSAPPNLPV